MNESLLFEHFLELNARYRGLRLTQDSTERFLVRGVLEFSAVFQNTQLEDEYTIQIIVPNEYPEEPPTVAECGGRIPKSYHMFSDNTLCLGAPVAVRMTFLQMPTLVGFVENNVIPQLYRFSYKEKFGEYPFGELSHGARGILEFYQQYFDVEEPVVLLGLLRILAEDNYRGHHKCPCSSGKKVRNCHGELLLEISKWQSSTDFVSEYSAIIQMLDEERKTQQEALREALLRVVTG